MTDEPQDVDALFEELQGAFGDLFGGGATKGPDIRMELELDRDDLIRGKREVTVERPIGCPGCHGTGRERAADDPCTSCEGKGKRQVRRGAFVMSTTCPDCQGSGSAAVCRRCNGDAVHQRRETLQVSIPPQIQDGQILRLRGKGGDDSDGKGPGDLYLTVRIPSAVPSSSPSAIPVRESGGSTALPWIVLGIAVVAIVVAALLLR